MKPKIIDMGTMHFTHDELVEFEDPQASAHPNGVNFHVFQCCDCGAHTDSGNADDIRHHITCNPGESDYWEKEYESMPTDEELRESGDLI